MKPLTIAGRSIPADTRARLALDVPKLYDFTDMKMLVEVIRGKEDGPILFVSAAIHGDEINGINIIRRLLAELNKADIKGTLIVIPIVNVFGFNDKTRYLPDRRDLNRCFPGDAHGSLAAQIAYLFRTEIVEKCTHGIDLHTGAIHRYNWPQIRTHIDHEASMDLAQAFGAPIILNAAPRDGSVREMVSTHDIPILLFEGGTALRFEDRSTECGVRGILNVMRHIGMIPGEVVMDPNAIVCRSSTWVRAPESGILIARKHLGDYVEAKEVMGVITNPFGEHASPVRAPASGILIGESRLPLANRGDALFHIAVTDEATSPVHGMAALQDSDYEAPAD